MQWIDIANVAVGFTSPLPEETPYINNPSSAVILNLQNFILKLESPHNHSLTYRDLLSLYNLVFLT